MKNCTTAPLWREKLFRIMKLTSFLLFCVIMQVAANSYSQKARLQISMQNVEVKDVLEEIKKQSEFDFLYKSDLIKSLPRVTVEVREVQVTEILEQIIPDDLEYEIYDRNIIIRKNPHPVVKPVEIEEDDVDISGKITDENGEGLPGASVIEKGTSNGTTTDLDGNYKLGLDETATLVVSFVGYKTAEIPIAGRSTIDLQMELDAEQLEEIVVVGYGQVKKRNLTSAVTKVGYEDIENRVSDRIDGALQGKLAGVTVQQSSGIPGAAPIVRVRGTGSITEGNQPLFVIDGMPVEDAVAFANINMNDVSSIEVLKDAASAAIYGSRGANGVVLITTKKGKSGASKVSYNMYYGLQKLEKRIDFLSGPEFAEVSAELRSWQLEQAGIDPSTPNDDRPSNLRIDPAWLTGDVPDWDSQDFIFHTAPITNHNVSVSGGTEKTNYFVSMDYFDQEGIVRNTSFKRYSFRSNIETQITDKIKIGLKLSPSFSKQLDNESEGKDKTLNRIMWMAPFVDLSKSFFNGSRHTNDYLNYYGFKNTPEKAYFLENLEQEYLRTQLISNSFMELKIFKGLTFKSSGALMFRAQKLSDSRDLQGGNGTRTSNVVNVHNTNWLWENTLNYDKTFEKHSFNVLLGYSSQRDYWETTDVRGRGFSNDIALTLSNATEINGWSQSIQEWSMASIFSRIIYDFDSRYLFSASVRRDGSSRFGINKKYGVFPSFSVGWRISNESFMEPIKAVTDMKLRISHGQTGNNRIGNYRTYSTLASKNATLGTDGYQAAGVVPQNLENQDLTWEKSSSTNIGLDLALLDYKLNLSLDLYNSTTNNLLLNVPVPLTSGFSNAIQNIGKVRNKGIEIEIESTNLSNSNLKWNTSFNMSFNKNEVLEMGPENAPIIEGEFFAQSSFTGVGEAIGSFYLWETNGVAMTQAQADAAPTFNGVAINAGDVIFVDQNGDGNVDADDRKILGQPMPKYNFGITNTLSYKNFDLSVFINGSGGHHTYNAVSRYYDRTAITTIYGHWRNRWRSESDPGNGITPTLRSNSRANGEDEEHDRWLWNSNWWRIKNITIGYNMPTKITEKLKISSLRIYVSGDNIFLNTGYIGFNPEGVSSLTGYGQQSESQASRSTGYDYSSYPLSKKFIIGFNVTF